MTLENRLLEKEIPIRHPPFLGDMSNSFRMFEGVVTLSDFVAGNILKLT